MNSHQPFLSDSQRKQGCCCNCQDEDEENDFVFTDAGNQQCAQFRTWFNEQFETLNSNYVGQLKSVLQDILEAKILINYSIDKLIVNIQDWIVEAYKQKQQHKMGLQQMKNNYFDDFIKKVNSKWLDSEKQFKKRISHQIEKFLQKQWIKNPVLNVMQNITLKVPSYYQTIQQFIEASPSIKCGQDNQQIIMIDINPNIPIDKRLACRECIQRDQSTYISIDDTQILWNKYKEMKQNQLKLYQKNHEEKITKTKKLLQQVRLDVTSTICNTLSVIDKQHKLILGILNDQQ